MTFNVVLAVLVILSIQFVYSVEQDAYSLLFADSKDVFLNKPIHFQYPLQKWLNGSLVRIGPAMFEMGQRNFTHAFDGFGKIYNWKFYGNGSASFSQDFLRSETYNVSNEINDIANYLTFESVSPPFPLNRREISVLNGFDNTNINVYRLFNEEKKSYEYIALTDAWKVYQFEPTSINTIGDIDPPNPRGTYIGFIDTMSSAHPVPEYNSSYHFTFLTSVSLIPKVKSRLSVIRMKSAFERELVAQWEVDKAPYMHSFSVTQRYVILFAAAYYTNIGRMLKYANAYEGLEWFPSEKATIYVVEIKTGNVHTIQTENGFPSHHVNAYEDNNRIIMDVTVFQDPAYSKIYELDTLRSPNKRQNAQYTAPVIKRYTINLNATNVTVTTFSPNSIFPFINNFDFPCINEKYRHRRYCYIYGVATKRDTTLFSSTALVKKDVCGTNQDSAFASDNHYPVDMWFISNPNSTREDDGILLTPVLDGEKQQSYLLMLDANTMAPINRGYLPSLVPFTMHGRFFSDLI
ncbi:retinoid isomerohydrolase-like [Mytilus edulis]|uniref:retinoid isomerohydrolase-like n=1 Tax=Mytilus edulis TaxID=6550 RepID=UPI0039F0C7FF